MFIKNFDEINIDYVEVDKMFGEYLEKNGFPVLYKDDKHFYFSDTKELKFALTKMPLMLRLRTKIKRKGE